MSVHTTNYVTLQYGSNTLTILVRYVEDDSFRIVQLNKIGVKKWEALQTIIGWKKVISIGFPPVTDEQRQFLSGFCMDPDDSCKIKIEGIQFDIRLVDPKLNLSFLDGQADALSVNWVLVEKALRRDLSRTYDLGTTTSATALKLGYNVILSYDYGDGAVSRQFFSESCNSFEIEIQRKEWEYADYDEAVANLGRKIVTEIVIGVNGLGTASQQQDDRDWMREFILAPSKMITPVAGIESAVTNDFDEVSYEMEDGFVGAKALALKFKEVETSTSIPTI